MEASGQISGRDLGRIAAFTDGVMAVAITLLVLNVEVPRLTPGEDLGDALRNSLAELVEAADPSPRARPPAKRPVAAQ